MERPTSSVSSCTGSAARGALKLFSPFIVNPMQHLERRTDATEAHPDHALYHPQASLNNPQPVTFSSSYFSHFSSRESGGVPVLRPWRRVHKWRCERGDASGARRGEARASDATMYMVARVSACVYMYMVRANALAKKTLWPKTIWPNFELG